MSMKDKIYEEVGASYRLFSKWRQATAIGVFVTLGAVVSLSISAFKDAKELLWVIPLLASPVGVLFYVFDLRCREHAYAAVRVGKLVEGDDRGFYTEVYDKIAIKTENSPYSKATQSLALHILFFAISGILVALSILFFYWYV